MAWASFSQAMTSSWWAISATPLITSDRLPAAQHALQGSCHYLDAVSESDCSGSPGACSARINSAVDGDRITMGPHEPAEDRSNGASGARHGAPIRALESHPRDLTEVAQVALKLGFTAF